MKSTNELSSEEEGLTLDEELEVLALLGDGEEAPAAVESTISEPSTSEDPDEAQLLTSLIQQLQQQEEEGEENENAPSSDKSQEKDTIDESSCFPHSYQEQDISSNREVHRNVHGQESCSNFEEDIAFFDQLGASQDMPVVESHAPVHQKSFGVEQEKTLSPVLSLGTSFLPAEAPTSRVSTEEAQSIQDKKTTNDNASDPVNHSFVPFVYYDPVFEAPAPVEHWQPSMATHNHLNHVPLESWYPAEAPFDPSHNAPVLLASESLGNHAQSVEMYPRQSHGKAPCSLIAFGIGGQSYALYISGSQTVENSSFKDLPAFVKSRNSCTSVTGPSGYGSMEYGEEARMADPALEDDLGPLGPSTNREKVLKFLSDRMQATTTRQYGNSQPSDLCLIWTTLALLSRNRGQLTVKTSEGERTDPDVIEMLIVQDPDHSGLNTNAGSLAVLKESQLRTHYDQSQLVAQIEQSLLFGKQMEALQLAKKGEMWSIALALSQSLGPALWAQTLEEMTSSLFHDGPLKTHFLLLAGKTTNVSTPPSKGPMLMSESSAQGNEMFHLFTPDCDPMLKNWRSTLAMLIANRVPGFRETIIQLGDKIWQQRNEIYAAHLCYLLAAVVPQIYSVSPECRIILLGADHRSCPDHFFTVEAFQRTEILEYILTGGKYKKGLPSLIPYKLIFARNVCQGILAEHGKISEAIHYCEVVTESLKHGTHRSSKEFNYYKYQAWDLLSQLKTHAETFHIKVERPTTLFKKMGDLLDKGINKLIGVNEIDDEVHRTGASSDGAALSDAYSVKKSSSMASLASSATGGSVSFVPQSQSWFTRMLGATTTASPSPPPPALGQAQASERDPNRRFEPCVSKKGDPSDFQEIQL